MEDSLLQQRIKALLDECGHLREESARLKALLEKNGLTAEHPKATIGPAEAIQRPAANAVSPEKKFALFRSLFRGREDVYALRWQRRDGKTGYSPASLMDWKAVRAARPEDRKKVTRQTRTLLPLTDQALRDHLQGKHTIGVYPLFPDETCWFLAVDFDKRTWREDAAAFAVARFNDRPLCVDYSSTRSRRDCLKEEEQGAPSLVR